MSDKHRGMTQFLFIGKTLLLNIVSGGIREEEKPEVKRRVILLNVLSFIGVMNLIPFGVIAFIQNNMGLWLFDHIAALVLIANIIFLRKTGNYRFAALYGVSFITSLYFYLFFTGGESNTAHLWLFTYPLIVSFLLGYRQGIIATLVLFVPIVLFVLIQQPPAFLANYSTDFKIRFIPSFIVVAAFAFSFEKTRETTQRKLEQNYSGLKALVSELKKAKAEHMEINQELLETQSQLVQSGKLSSIGELASGIAHELNQPLTVVRGNTQLLARNLWSEKLAREEIDRMLASVEKNTKRMMDIINHVRVFSRQTDRQFSRTELNQVIDESFLMVGEQLRVLNIQVKKTLSDNLSKVYGNATQLEQVFLNLITNARDAIEFSRNHSGKPVNGLIEIASRESVRRHGFVEVTVTDTGCGIAPENIPVIFDPFYTSKEVGKGTGLGLSISYGIVKEHNGEIEVVETGPKGTKICVMLPAM